MKTGSTHSPPLHRPDSKISFRSESESGLEHLQMTKSDGHNKVTVALVGEPCWNQSASLLPVGLLQKSETTVKKVQNFKLQNKKGNLLNDSKKKIIRKTTSKMNMYETLCYICIIN